MTYPCPSCGEQWEHDDDCPRAERETVELSKEIVDELDDYRESKAWEIKQKISRRRAVLAAVQEARSYEKKYRQVDRAASAGIVRSNDDLGNVVIGEEDGGKIIMKPNDARELAHKLLLAASDAEGGQ